MKIPVTITTDTLEWMFKQFTSNPVTTITFGNDQTEHTIEFTCDNRLPSQWSMPKKGQPSEPVGDLAFTLPEGIFPSDVSNSIRSTYSEALICFQNNCLSATLGLCGKIIETSLWSTYSQKTGETPDEKNLGLSAILNRLNKDGYQLKKDAITQQMELIGLHRNKAIHGGVVPPTYDQAKGILHLTRDVLVRLQSKTLESK